MVGVLEVDDVGAGRTGAGGAVDEDVVVGVDEGVVEIGGAAVSTDVVEGAVGGGSVVVGRLPDAMMTLKGPSSGGVTVMLPLTNHATRRRGAASAAIAPSIVMARARTFDESIRRSTSAEYL